MPIFVMLRKYEKYFFAEKPKQFKKRKRIKKESRRKWNVKRKGSKKYRLFRYTASKINTNKRKLSKTKIEKIWMVSH